MKWEVRKLGERKWGIFLMQKYCKTDEPVCYGVTSGPNAELSARSSAERMNKNFKDEKQV